MKKILGSRLLLVIVTMIFSMTMSVIATTTINSNAVSYTNSKTNETTVEGSLNELFSSVDINKRLGDTTKISDIGDGTVSGAINTINNNVENTVSLGKYYQLNRTIYMGGSTTEAVSVTIDELKDTDIKAVIFEGYWSGNYTNMHTETALKIVEGSYYIVKGNISYMKNANEFMFGSIIVDLKTGVTTLNDCYNTSGYTTYRVKGYYK